MRGEDNDLSVLLRFIFGTAVRRRSRSAPFFQGLAYDQMSCLSAGEAFAGRFSGDGEINHADEKRRAIASAATLVVAPDRLGDFDRVVVKFYREKLEQSLG